MYEEEKKNSFIKDFIIKLLYMFLFLFLFMWLYPAPKVDLSDVEVKVDKTELQPLFAGVFNDNINSMKEAAKSYYTIDRLPSTNGKSSKMTLQEMLNKKIVAPFVDANGKSCNASASYVEVTRISATEYTMKVNLECSDKTDYIMETIGCTSVCPGCVATPASTTSTKTTTTNKVVSQPTVVRPSTNVTPTVSQPKTYIYTKEVTNETWELNNTWTDDKKTGSDVKVYDTRTVEGDVTYETESYTYRTVSWVASWDQDANYTLILNQNTIPSNARNVRITSSSKITTPYELNKYINRRYSCDIRMDGNSCPRRTDDSIIQDRYLTSTPIATFRYSLDVYKSNGRWKVDVNANTTNTFYGEQKYIIPIKFTVTWQEPVREEVKEYKYQYLKVTKSTLTEYSSSSNDTNLINAGYKLVGTK
ncbi:MAG: hypothetical protein E7166_02690 [Firmicutes bacterium]|nr:hypothetical protein [Bacillota bacterium]